MTAASRIILFCLVLLSAQCSNQPAKGPPGADQPKRPSSNQAKRKRLFTVQAADSTGQDLTLFVDTGEPGETVEYNRELEQRLGIPATASLDAVLKFCGYTVTARELEIASPASLTMTFGPDVTSVRFFAPKIVDVSKSDGDLGWRNVIRLKVKANSSAAAKGLESMFLLFNVFQPRAQVGADPFKPCETDTAPFKTCSQNNQVMLTVHHPTPGSPTAYWLVFEAAGIDGGKRTDHLNATFDGGDQASTDSGSAVKAYYVPSACAQCHGGSQETAKLNVLDSDHWNSRVQPGDDFGLVQTAGIGVLPDAGNVTGSSRFKAVFEQLTALNREIRAQIATAAGEDFQLRAADVWLGGHATSTAFASLISRSLPAPSSEPNAATWKDTPEDTALLQLLDRYCYRCHSSIAYHVFDKEAVFQRRNGMVRRIQRGPQASGGMPQDRVLPASAVDDFVSRLRAMQR